jgi:hypothetical protein
MAGVWLPGLGEGVAGQRWCVLRCIVGVEGESVVEGVEVGWVEDTEAGEEELRVLRWRVEVRGGFPGLEAVDLGEDIVELGELEW